MTDLTRCFACGWDRWKTVLLLSDMPVCARCGFVWPDKHVVDPVPYDQSASFAETMGWVS